MFMDKTRTIIVAVVIILIIAIGAFVFISANSHNTKIDVLSNDTLKNGDSIRIMLTDEYRNAYPGEIVYIKVLDDSGWAHKYEVTTDDSGEGSVELMGLDNGNYTIHCNFNGTMFNKASHSLTNLKIDDGLG
jgi:hypothetical protein